ncbi:hypothetical protein [Mangrovihabitans endophyticus]|uniref:Uncharacterized protein n=1 Tax=Mangrovihabitans endophyticus TaxID=1751298 RepID=A0A8J3FT90_9ACTN|nr:hypothetical protein [Mangrovihabitans endophyticus]GGL18673.1 hypothetical protein GCM10012284_61600 [Mangrovihabitans endophyticus]
MSGMADADPSGGLWNWCAAAPLDASHVRLALAAVLGVPVTDLAAEPGAAPEPGVPAVLCDVWHVAGDFPTTIDCYLVPAGRAEATAAAALAARLDTALLMPDDTLNPTRYLLVTPDGSRQAVHVDERETDDGVERRHPRPCTGHDPACAAYPGCGGRTAAA